MSKKPRHQGDDGEWRGRQFLPRPVTGFVQCDGSMTPEQFGALQRALAGGDESAIVVIPASNFTDVAGVPNRLFGSYINEEGEAV
jgi:hypothetical protein